MKITNECGTFIIDENGLLNSYKPDSCNIIENPNTNEYRELCIEKLIIPEGVIELPNMFMRDSYISSLVSFPKSLKSIGRCCFDGVNQSDCVFADCDLPTIALPKSISEIGTFAFGKSRIKKLILPTGLTSMYARQFKDSHISLLLLPYEDRITFIRHMPLSILLRYNLCTEEEHKKCLQTCEEQMVTYDLYGYMRNFALHSEILEVKWY